MTFSVGEVILRKGKNTASQNARPIARTKSIREPECRNASHHKRKYDDGVVRLDERHQSQEGHGQHSIEQIQGVADEANPARVVQVRSGPGRHVENNKGTIDPPEIPNILESVAGVGEEERRE